MRLQIILTLIGSLLLTACSTAPVTNELDMEKISRYDTFYNNNGQSISNTLDNMGFSCDLKEELSIVDSYKIALVQSELKQNNGIKTNYGIVETSPFQSESQKLDFIKEYFSESDYEINPETLIQKAVLKIGSVDVLISGETGTEIKNFNDYIILVNQYKDLDQNKEEIIKNVVSIYYKDMFGLKIINIAESGESYLDKNDLSIEQEGQLNFQEREGLSYSATEIDNKKVEVFSLYFGVCDN